MPCNEFKLEASYTSGLHSNLCYVLFYLKLVLGQGPQPHANLASYFVLTLTPNRIPRDLKTLTGFISP